MKNIHTNVKAGLVKRSDLHVKSLVNGFTRNNRVAMATQNWSPCWKMNSAWYSVFNSGVLAKTKASNLKVKFDSIGDLEMKTKNHIKNNRKEKKVTIFFPFKLKCVLQTRLWV